MSPKTVLLTGASGTLGSAIKNSGLFGDLLTPPHSELDITNKDQIEKYFSNNEFDTIIHCAALARMKACQEDKKRAFLVNEVGTKNLVDALKKKNPSIRFLHISTDGVYAGTNGNYSEESETNPYNVYGESKLAGEKHVGALFNHCIIRTSFFDSDAIRFDDSAVDMFSSKIPISELVSAISLLMNSDFVGVINVGGERRSDYERYKQFKPDLKETTFEKIQASVSFPLAKDASMNISKWKELKRKDH